MHGKKNIAIILLLYFLCGPGQNQAETIYDQPYLGVWPYAFLRELYSAEALRQQAANNLAAIVQQSDLIILAGAGKFKEIKSLDQTGRTEFYEGDFVPIKIFKGRANVTSFHLKFKPSATGIKSNARHIFFLKKDAGTFKVLKASYIYPKGKGYDNHIRITGYIDGSADVAIDVIKYLIDRKARADLNARMMDEYMSENWGKMSSAVFMASSTAPAVGIPVLKKMVSVYDRKRFDLWLYGTAAYALALQQRRDTWQALLENIPSGDGYDRVPESIAFDLVAVIADKEIIPLLKEIVSKKPDLAVSAAFALSNIGGQEARRVIESWTRDEQLTGRETLISNGRGYKRSFGELFKKALKQMKTTNK